MRLPFLRRGRGALGPAVTGLPTAPLALPPRPGEPARPLVPDVQPVADYAALLREHAGLQAVPYAPAAPAREAPALEQDAPEPAPPDADADLPSPYAPGPDPTSDLDLDLVALSLDLEHAEGLDAEQHVPEPRVPEQRVPEQDAPRVVLTFSDGTPVELDPTTEESRALAALAGRLTAGD